MATLTPSAKQQFFDANGNPLSGGKLYTYAAGTTIPLATYTDFSGGTSNTNPVILDSRGEANVWLGSAVYKFRLTTSTDVEIWTVDNISSYNYDVLTALAASSGSSLVGFIQSGTGATARTVQSKLCDVVSVKDSGAIGDGITDDTTKIQAAVNSLLSKSGGVLFFPPGVYRTSSPIELSSSSTVAKRVSVALHGPACIKPLNTFSGSQVIQHTQTAAQANVSSFGYGAHLSDIEIDGSSLPAGTTHGIRFDGAWQPVWRNVNVHNVTGNGWHVPADNSIYPTNDDNYAVISLTAIDCKFSNNAGWGVYQSRFSGDFTAINTYVSDNTAGGVRITSANVTWIAGAIAYNGGVGLQFSKSSSAITSTLSNCTFVSTEIDRNAINNIWFENAYNCSIQRPRLIAAESGAGFNGGVYIPPTMVKFGGTAGQDAFGIEIVQPYVRDNQQTTNPAFTIYDFTAQSNDCKVTGQTRLVGGTSNVTTGTTAGQRNFVSDYTGLGIFGDGVPLRNAYAEARLTNSTTVSSTGLTDIVFDYEVIDQAGKYDPATGIYSFGSDNGLFVVKGFLTVSADAAVSDRTVNIHLRYDDGSGTFSSSKYCTIQVIGNSLAQNLPFDFPVPVVSQNCRVKIAAIASTSTALAVGAQTTQFSVYKI